MSAPLVVIVTLSYPYGTGEQFVGAELQAWARSGARVVLLPTIMRGEARPLPAGIEVDDAMWRRWSTGRPIPRAARTLASPGLRAELTDLRRLGRLTARSARTALVTSIQAREMAAALAEVAARRGAIDVVYTYWLTPFTAGAVQARDAGAARRVVSRTHNSDLYEDLRDGGHAPLVRSGMRTLDALHPISVGGGDYAVERYGFEPGVVRPARLGVDIPPSQRCAPPSDDGRLRLLSISTMTPIKRLDLLVEAIALVAEGGRPVTWRHLGEGPLRPQVEQLVRERLEPLGVEVVLEGQLDHDELLRSLSRPADLMVNTSSSEGVPVSIMEAQAHGIPCLATDVGATREVVLPDYLVPADVTPDALAAGIRALVDDARTPQRRAEVRARVTDDFDSARNHAAFVAEVVAGERS